MHHSASARTDHCRTSDVDGARPFLGEALGRPWIRTIRAAAAITRMLETPPDEAHRSNPSA